MGGESVLCWKVEEGWGQVQRGSFYCWKVLERKESVIISCLLLSVVEWGEGRSEICPIFVIILSTLRTSKFLSDKYNRRKLIRHEPWNIELEVYFFFSLPIKIIYNILLYYKFITHECCTETTILYLNHSRYVLFF